MDEIVIEQATIEDLSRLTDLLTDLFSRGDDFTPDRVKQMRGVRLLLEQPGRGRIFVARQNDEIVGMINLLFTISTAEGGFVILLEDLIVEESSRQHGVGDKLLKSAIQYARDKHFLRITLLTSQLSPDAQRFFLRHGFYESKMIPMRLILSSDSAETSAPQPV